MKIVSFNCRNFKSNYLSIDKIIDLGVDIIFICEHWLNSKEQYLIDEKYSRNFKTYFQSDMDIQLSRKFSGRPFGGKCWLVKNDIKVISVDFNNPDFSIIKFFN